ncbi:MAG: hypothetical protein R6U91_06710 [Bacillota bacterium]
MEPITILFIVIAILVVFYLFRRKIGSYAGMGKTKSLRQEARRQLKLPQKEADQTIDRHVERLKERYPNRSEEWYLEKLIYDLKRDR